MQAVFSSRPDIVLPSVSLKIWKSSKKTLNARFFHQWESFMSPAKNTGLRM